MTKREAHPIMDTIALDRAGVPKRLVGNGNGSNSDKHAAQAARLARSVVPEEYTRDTRFETQQAYLTYIDKQIAAGELSELAISYHQTRSELIGEIVEMTSLRMVNSNPYNPGWECMAKCNLAPGGTIKLIIWGEDLMPFIGDFHSDPWVFMSEWNETEPSDSPDDWRKACIVAMDIHGNYRPMPLPEGMREAT